MYQDLSIYDEPNNIVQILLVLRGMGHIWVHGLKFLPTHMGRRNARLIWEDEKRPINKNLEERKKVTEKNRE